ncbi:MAG TPA: hypothetical protein VH969_23165 [Actinophytocola sp.]|uniref:hypothetical protein n=1 Tax=Actinophytocola sp. TaxID=1872138 RepID=UPI002F94E9CA
MPQNVGPKAESAQYHGPPVRPTGPGDPGNSHAAREFGGYAGSAAGQIVGKMIGLQDGARGGLGRVGKELGEMVGDVVDTVLDPRYEAAPPPGEPGGMSMSPGMSVDPNTLGWGGSSVDHGDPQMSVDPGHAGPPMSVDPGSIGWGGSSHAPPGMSVDPSAAGWGGMSHAADGPMSVDPGGHHDPGVSNATGAPADHGQADAGGFAH